MAGRPIGVAGGAARRSRLSRERIVDAAIALIERDGSEALSMRRLGNELGVEGMAIYRYVDGRDALVRAIGDRLLEPLHGVEMTGGWRAAADRYATALRAIAVQSPGTFPLIGLQPLDTPMQLQPVERLLDALIADGFDACDALAVYRAVAAYARGYALAEATGFTVDAAEPAGRRRLLDLAAGEFPILAGRVSELAHLDADRGFRVGLDALLAGLPNPRSSPSAPR
ncbi:MAG TPA: TetR/AcrR family transcriptional regulator C-terminal domain-containing protein [Dactylosporangium sp.]|nr:TetR/AcrR family transcriptional regulator C-terminal domain-containing protein [Dactylosporangium sp.]